MRHARIVALHVALPLALGALSYVVLRDRWPLIPPLWRSGALWKGAPAVLRDHFADAAWGWALGGFVSWMWLGEKARRRATWLAVAALVAGGVECLQYAHVLRGAFDPVDLVVQVGAVVAAGLAVGGHWKWTSESV